jgi:hypothetical protein
MEAANFFVFLWFHIVIELKKQRNPEPVLLFSWLGVS